MKRLRLFPRSLRWRLPLSYAAVALLTAVVLGVVLLSALRLYYQEREAGYLQHSANTVAAVLAQSLAEGVPVETLRDQVTGLAYLTGTRVQLTNLEGVPIADSGPFNPLQLRFVLPEQVANRLSDGDGPIVPEPTILPEQPILPEPAIPPDPTVPPQQPDQINPLRPFPRSEDGPIIGRPIFDDDLSLRLTIPSIESLYAFRPGRFAFDLPTRSGLSITQAVVDTTGGDVLGLLTVSGGPAYSEGILSGVAAAWVVAGIIAVLLAALAGWLVSWRMRRPLVGLTGVTAKMTGGDLSVRADARREDEFGVLAVSFNEMADRLQAFILTLQRFVADAAHELNTPLTALRNNLDLALEETDPAKQASLIKDGRSQVRRLEELARGLLALSQLESGEQQREHQPVNLANLVLKLSEQYASQAEQAGLTFTMDIGVKEEGDPVVVGDEGQLQRALGNLLDNAIKFTPEGGQVRLGMSSDDQWVSLWVEDSGIGIPDKDLPLLFNRFHRGRNVAGYPGSGLGLAIVRAIALHHKGEVAAQNTNQGACLTIRLPLV